MSNPLVSVIITTYNHERYIRKSIDSVLSQKTTFEYEILVGDDASNDSTANILNEYVNDMKIKIYVRQKNIGANRNCYELLKESKGKYVALLDGDDFWISDNKLQKQVEFLENHSSYVGCATKSVCIDENDNELLGVNIPWVCSKREFRLEDFDGIHLPGQTSSIVKRNLFNDSKHDMSIIYKTHPDLGDRFSILIYLCEGDFYCIEEYLSAYRMGVNLEENYNLTKKLSKNRTDRIKADVLMTKAMEDYAVCHNKRVNFEKYKQALFEECIWHYLRSDSDVDINMINDIWNNLKKSSLGIIFLYRILIKAIGLRGCACYLKKRITRLHT